jgi:hypothetical protein
VHAICSGIASPPSLIEPGKWCVTSRNPSLNNSPPLPWAQEVERFFGALKRFDDYLEGNEALHASPEKLFQGPVADALNHVGQIAMLRRMAGFPIKGENYFKADIAAGRVGPQQAPPRREFD